MNTLAITSLFFEGNGSLMNCNRNLERGHMQVRRQYTYQGHWRPPCRGIRQRRCLRGLQTYKKREGIKFDSHKSKPVLQCRSIFYYECGLDLLFWNRFLVKRLWMHLIGCSYLRRSPKKAHMFPWQSSYGFVDYYDHRSAAAALSTLNSRQM